MRSAVRDILFYMIICASLASGELVLAEELSPVLKIKFNDTTREYKRDELLNFGSAQKISIANDPTYPGQTMEYIAVPAKELFGGLSIPSDATVQFVCLDGFSAPLTLSRLLGDSPQAATPYIAIEPSNKKWPALKGKGSKTAGPFYLVWLHPERSKVGPEEWPFQLASFEIQPPLQKQFPKVAPGPEVSATNPVVSGYNLFVKNCFACHTMNGQGNSKLGPDLNIPYGPTEYLREAFILKLIRNPQSLRKWPESKMSSFSSDTLSDKDVSAILAYLKYMSGHKAK